MVDEITEVGQGARKYTLSDPHPLHGKDPNIINEYGHTEYPKYVHQFDEKGAIKKDVEVIEKANDKGHMYKTVGAVTHYSRVVNNESEEEEAVSEGFAEKWVKPEKVKPVVQAKKEVKPVGWDK